MSPTPDGSSQRRGPCMQHADTDTGANTTPASLSGHGTRAQAVEGCHRAPSAPMCSQSVSGVHKAQECRPDHVPPPHRCDCRRGGCFAPSQAQGGLVYLARGHHSPPRTQLQGSTTHACVATGEHASAQPAGDQPPGSQLALEGSHAGAATVVRSKRRARGSQGTVRSTTGPTPGLRLHQGCGSVPAPHHALNSKATPRRLSSKCTTLQGSVRRHCPPPPHMSHHGSLGGNECCVPHATPMPSPSGCQLRGSELTTAQL